MNHGTIIKTQISNIISTTNSHILLLICLCFPCWQLQHSFVCFCFQWRNHGLYCSTAFFRFCFNEGTMDWTAVPLSFVFVSAKEPWIGLQYRTPSIGRGSIREWDCNSDLRIFYYQALLVISRLCVFLSLDLHSNNWFIRKLERVVVLCDIPNGNQKCGRGVFRCWCGLLALVHSPHMRVCTRVELQN